MKVLLSAFQCGPGQGSELGNGWNWARALSDCGHDVTVITLSSFEEEIRKADPRGVKFHFVEVPWRPAYRLSFQLGLYHYYVSWQDAALRHVEMQPGRYDVVHHVAWGSLHLGTRLWRLPAPLVYGPIGGGQTAPAKYWRYFGRDWPSEALRTQLTTGQMLKLNRRSRETIQNSAVTLVTNSATAVASRRLGATDVRYMLAEGLPVEWIAEPRPQPTGPPVVLWLGRLLARKAPTLAVQAFAELRRLMPARLVMAGDGPLRDQVRKEVARCGVADDVELLGQVPWKEIGRLYSSASVFLFTSLRDSSGSQFLEALGKGLPAVALDHHGVGDADVGAAAIKVALPAEPRDLPGCLAAAMQTILCDDQWESRSAAGIKWAGEWTWPAKAATAGQIYRDVV
jgi:glycosyltransferase involved in cell wall biosynthesis